MKKVLEKINDRLTSLPATIVGGIFLLAGFILSRTGYDFVADPSWVTVIICGIPLLYLAICRTVGNKGIAKISSAHLICIAMIAAITIGDVFAAGEVAFIMAIGEILEDATVNRAKKGLRSLISIVPTQGRRIINGREETINADEILNGDVLRIFPGEAIPVDGVIVDGETSVDQSIITGESLPIDKSVGEEVFCGTINRFGSIDVRATKVGMDTSLQKLIRTVRDVENKKAPMARTADKAASWLVPSALLIAVLTWLLTGEPVRAVTVLVVFCPCALVLATPTAVMAAIGQATKHGIVIKSGEALEKMCKVDTIAFDKTGTLTYGRLEVCDIISFSTSENEYDLLKRAASVESKSEHPIGKAIVDYARQNGVSVTGVTLFKMSVGKGVEAFVDGEKVLCGNKKYLSDNGVAITDDACKELEILQLQGKAAVLVAVNDVCMGIVALSDIIREESSDMIRKLSKMNTKAVLLTGDNVETASYVGDKVGISNIFAELLPEEKMLSIKKLHDDGNCVCMIGDGVNDAPALEVADVGIAMGKMGSDIAVEAADITLIGDDVSQIPYLKRLSEAMVKTIKFGITLSMIINLVAVTLSVKGVLNPTVGALVHNVGSCFVVMTAALLYDRKFD